MLVLCKFTSDSVLNFTIFKILLRSRVEAILVVDLPRSIEIYIIT